MKKIRIISEGGHANDTKVIDVETGKEIEGIRAIHLTMQGGMSHLAVIEFYELVEALDVEAFVNLEQERLENGW